jgi:prevent-host-death family protein
MGSVGVRQLRDRLSYYLRRVRTGKHLIVTEGGKSVAVLSPPVARARDARIEAMAREGIIVSRRDVYGAE